MRTAGTRDPEVAAAAAALEARSDPRTLAAWMREDLTTYLRPRLASIATPALEIVPDDASSANALLAGTPDARVAVVAPARHFLMLDAPDGFYAAVAAFLDAHQ
jgi:pimeloyl-ACP methyl ester carboxylesterase